MCEYLAKGLQTSYQSAEFFCSSGSVIETYTNRVMSQATASESYCTSLDTVSQQMATYPDATEISGHDETAHQGGGGKSAYDVKEAEKNAEGEVKDKESTEVQVKSNESVEDEERSKEGAENNEDGKESAVGEQKDEKSAEDEDNSKESAVAEM